MRAFKRKMWCVVDGKGNVDSYLFGGIGVFKTKKAAKENAFDGNKVVKVVVTIEET